MPVHAPLTSSARPARSSGKSRAAWIAAALAAAAVFNNLRARNAERAHPPRGRFIGVDGVRLHYLEQGVGPSVVLLHGNVVTAEDYALSGVLERVAERHRVISPDRPGFGYSERPRGKAWTPAEQADLLASAFLRLGLERPVVVGHSWGAIVALAMGLRHPGLVGGLVLLAGYYKPTLRLDVPLAASPAIPVLGDLLRHTVSPLLGTALLPLSLKAMFSPLPVPDRFRRRFPHAFPVRPGQIRAEAQDAASMVSAVRAMEAHYRDLHLPVTIMAGTHDRVVDLEAHAMWLHEALPDSELKVLPGVGHMLHYAAPEQVAAAIEEVSRR